MTDERTVRHAGISGIPVQSIEAVVIEGPDAGMPNRAFVAHVTQDMV